MTEQPREQWATRAGFLFAAIGSAVGGSRTLYVHVRGPGELPPIEGLLDDLAGRIPDGVPIVVDTTRGRQITAGRVGTQGP
ncbi:hypothetical protein ABXI76_13270 [Streptomyces parvus]